MFRLLKPLLLGVLAFVLCGLLLWLAAGMLLAPSIGEQNQIYLIGVVIVTPFVISGYISARCSRLASRKQNIAMGMGAGLIDVTLLACMIHTGDTHAWFVYVFSVVHLFFIFVGAFWGSKRRLIATEN